MNYLKAAQDAFDASTTYVDQNYRKHWEYGIRAFQNEHAPGSKYLAEDYKARSKIFRPKTRTIIRKNEAAASIALFANEDVVLVSADDEDNAYAVASAEATKALLQYRLNKSIPWFKTCMGALQDAQTTGVVCSYNYWEYKKLGDRVVKDRPCIDLRPIENIRIDPAASWIDPVGTSPFFIDIIPMYVTDVRTMMKQTDDKTGRPKWKNLGDEYFQRALPESVMSTDTTRRLREGKGQLDPHTDMDRPITDYSLVYVLKVFLREPDGEKCFFMLGKEEMLTDPKPIEEVYFHGVRPYVIGNAIIETHKALPHGVAQLSRPLQVEVNEIANQRLDNVKLVLNKRWFVARGRQVDTASLLRNVPGGVTFMNDPKTDVQESNWPDVTSSAYMEQDRLNVDFDELVGNFSGSSVQSNRSLNETVGGMRMIAQGASVMTEYLLRTFIETWVEPTLRQMVLLEQAYETDQHVLAIAGKKAKLFQRFGISQVTDDLLNQEVFLTVNVGQGATDPQARLQKFVGAVTAAIKIIAEAPSGINVEEVVKEIFTYAGFREGSRFVGQGDPRLAQAQQMIQQLQGALNGKQMDLQAQAQMKQMEIASNERTKGAEIQVNYQRIQGDLAIRQAEVAVSQAELELERMKIMVEAEGQSTESQMKVAEMAAKIEEAKLKIAHEAQRIQNEQMKQAHEMQMSERESMSVQSTDNQIGQVTGQIADTITQMRQKMETLKPVDVSEDLGGMKASMEELVKGLIAVAGNVEQLGKKKKMTGYSVNKREGKRVGLTVNYDDGTYQTLTEQ
jgi:hypothetical protein